MPETTSTPRAIAETVGALPSSAADRFGDRLAARYKVDGEWREMTYAETLAAVQEIALGLAALGIEPGDRVGVLSDTRVEWTLSSYGISACRASSCRCIRPTRRASASGCSATRGRAP